MLREFSLDQESTSQRKEKATLEHLWVKLVLKSPPLLLRSTKEVKEIDHLAKIAHSQPQSAYCALTNGLMSRWNYLMHVVPYLGDKLQPIEEALWFRLLPAITGQSNISALPARDGGLGMPILTEMVAEQHRASHSITEPIVALCTGQNTEPLPNIYIVQEELKGETKKHRQEKQQETSTTLKNSLPPTLQKAVELASEKGASTWLTTLPIRAHGFFLHKQAFRDALCIRYGWDLQGLPSHCSCGAQFNTTHAFNCHRGAFPTITSATWQPSFSLKGAQVLRLNHAFNPYLKKLSHTEPKTWKTMLDLED